MHCGKKLFKKALTERKGEIIGKYHECDYKTLKRTLSLKKKKRYCKIPFSFIKINTTMMIMIMAGLFSGHPPWDASPGDRLFSHSSLEAGHGKSLP